MLCAIPKFAPNFNAAFTRPIDPWIPQERNPFGRNSGEYCCGVYLTELNTPFSFANKTKKSGPESASAAWASNRH